MTTIHRLPARSRRQGSFNLAIPPAQAFDLFTAEGERPLNGPRQVLRGA